MDAVKDLWKIKTSIFITFILLSLVFVLIGSEKRFLNLLLLLPAICTLYYGYFIFGKSKNYPILAVSIVAAVVSPVIILLLTNQSIHFKQAIYTFIFASGCFCSSVALSSIFNKNIIGKIIVSLVPLLILFSISLVWGYYFIAKEWITDDVILALAQTNMSESIEWLKDFVTIESIFEVFIASTITLFIIFLLWKIKYSFSLPYYRKNIHLMVFFVLGVVLIFVGRKNIFYPIATRSKMILSRYEQFQKQYNKRQNTLTTDYKYTSKNSKGVFVLVIGESQNKDHMQVYGYNRPTTPWLSEIIKKENIILMRNAYSCHTHTVPVITYALTAKNQYNNIALENAISIIDAAKLADYNTVWISNQVKYGTWDTPNTVIASSADQQIWINKNLGETTDTNSYDAELAEQIDKLKMHEKMLIVFHLMGNHGQYAQRYPKEYAKFSGDPAVDTYDNSVLYNDYVVKRIYDRCTKLPNFKGMLYCADHADAVREKLGHNSGKFIYPMSHIPFYGIFSDEYINENRAKIEIFKSHTNSVLTNDLLFDTVNSIMGIEVQGVYNSKNDILSDKYDGNIDRFTTLYGKRKIKDDPSFKIN